MTFRPRQGQHEHDDDDESNWQDVIIREVTVSYSMVNYRVSLPKKNGEWSNAIRAVYGGNQLRRKPWATLTSTPWRGWSVPAS